jgi:hypothetical protein
VIGNLFVLVMGDGAKCQPQSIIDYYGGLEMNTGERKIYTTESYIRTI